MSSPLFLANQKVLLTRQRHEAKRAGLHYDYRIVVGDKAYSWATKKEMPGPGKSILLFEQPVHDATYALSKEVIIPDGEYGAGRTTLEFVRKASVGEGAKDNHFSLNFDGQRLTFWKIPPESNFYQKKMGKKADGVWMLWNRSDYKEGPESTYTHNGKTATVDSLIAAAKNVPTVSVPIPEMEWALEDAKINPDRLKAADLKHPLIATMHAGRVTVLDGTHRLAKAVNEGRSELGVKLIPDPSPVEKKANMSNKYLEKIAKIAIKPSHEGLLHKDLGVPAGEKIPADKLSAAKEAAKKSGDVAEEKRIVFAENAKKWNHK